MPSLLRAFFINHSKTPLWGDDTPIREELFGPERLEQHAKSLALAQKITSHPRVVPSLQARLKANAGVLLAAYRSSAASLAKGNKVVPAAEWLLDNYHLVELQIREIHDDLPPGYYRQLPKLAEGPFAGYPRVFGIAWAFVAHTDSHFDARILQRFIAAYQEVQPLTIGELWAVAITLRIVLIENLRRLADQITAGRRQREEPAYPDVQTQAEHAGGEQEGAQAGDGVEGGLREQPDRTGERHEHEADEEPRHEVPQAHGRPAALTGTLSRAGPRSTGLAAEGAEVGQDEQGHHHEATDDDDPAGHQDVELHAPEAREHGVLQHGEVVGGEVAFGHQPFDERHQFRIRTGGVHADQFGGERRMQRVDFHLGLRAIR